MGTGVTQQSPHLRRSVASATQARADNNLLHVLRRERVAWTLLGRRPAALHRRRNAMSQLAACPRTAPARKHGFAQHLDWARGLDPERVWAIEDCRHVSGGLERFLAAAGERVIRVPPKLMGQSRKGSRRRGKSDPDRRRQRRPSGAAGGSREPARRPPRRRVVAAPSVRELRSNLSSLLDDVSNRRDHVLVTRNGAPAAALVPIDEYEALEETAEILSDPDALAALETGLAEIERGETVTLTELRSELAERRAAAG